NGQDSPAPRSAAKASCGVIFDGTLYNASELRRELRDFISAHDCDDAELIASGYLKWGEALLPRLRGTFALLIRDTARDLTLCLRDPIGTYPLFYSATDNGYIFSTSIDVLIKQPSVSGAVNRAALTDFMLDRFPILEETFYESIKRVSPGHVLRIKSGVCTTSRYWDPAPDGKVTWLTEDELEKFDSLLNQAVERCLSFGQAGIFLSGGLDSVSVAAVAAERAVTNGGPKPWALSLVFPDADVNEEIVQRGVASQLGLSHVLKPFYDAAGPKGLLHGAAGLNPYLPGPIRNTWLP